VTNPTFFAGCSSEGRRLVPRHGSGGPPHAVVSHPGPVVQLGGSASPARTQRAHDDSVLPQLDPLRAHRRLMLSSSVTVNCLTCA
jgi:hypothetical protein